MAGSTAEIRQTWWKQAVVYQIFPSSFKDSNGDGVGDLQGIISKIDHIASLGVDAIWLSPCYKSPHVDMGYDISDYRDIHEPYGTLEDFDVLLAELKKSGIRLLMDLVINHTSNEHPWFLESKSSLTNPKRDWYIWRQGKVGANGESLPPNNWESLFKGGAWEYDATTDEYYFHLFASAQPDLNWENPEVRAAIYADIDFWLKKGVSGFRMDAINLISKPMDFPDAPAGQRAFETCCNQVYNRPQVHEWLREMKTKVLNQYKDLVTIGECAGTADAEEIQRYIRDDRKELDIIFQFGVACIDFGLWGVFSRRDWDLGEIKRSTREIQTMLRPSWNTWHLENHDSGRSVNRYCRTSSSEHFPAVSKLLAFYMMTVGGTIFLHQGQEIGAQNLTEDICLHEYKDMLTHSDINNHRVHRMAAQGRVDVDMSDVKREVLLKARDHSRVPMAWDGSKGAGFTTGESWMTLGTTYKNVNVADQEKSEQSVLNTWRAMIAFRKQYQQELVYGSFELVDEGHEQIFAYSRTARSGSRILIALNWSDQAVTWQTPESYRNGKVLKAVGGVDFSGGKVHLFPYACVAWWFCCWWC